MAKQISKSLIRKAKGGQLIERHPSPRRDVLSTEYVVGNADGERTKRITISDEPTPPRDRRSVPATQAKNRFGEILQAVRDSGPVFIERHGQAQAVVLDIETYNKLTSNERTTQERELDYWTREFNALHAGMQTQGARDAVDALFSATDTELNRKGS